MKIFINTIVFFGLMSLFSLKGNSQGFINLDFESATFLSDSTSGFYPYAVYATNAIPGWTAYVANTPQTEIFSNNVSLSGGAVSIIGTNWVYPQIQGKYFILLQGFNYPGYLNTAGIGQTGTIPFSAQSLIFWGNVSANDVSFNGHELSLVVIGSTLNYNIYQTDISPFAGQLGQLLFTTIPGGTDIIDNIQFSSTPVPEPGVLGLLGLGGFFLVWHRWIKLNRKFPS